MLEIMRVQASYQWIAALAGDDRSVAYSVCQQIEEIVRGPFNRLAANAQALHSLVHPVDTFCHEIVIVNKLRRIDGNAGIRSGVPSLNGGLLRPEIVRREVADGDTVLHYAGEHGAEVVA